ncbi:MAG: hypothetical protein VYD90_10655 [Pseudomonadota bacterium]|nr:hypothetical protein [Pseudomonadota bacterium]
MRELLDFLPFVRPYAPAVPEPVAEAQVRNAAREFCEATKCWRIIDTIPVRGDEIEVLCVPPQATLHELERAIFNKVQLAPIAADQVDPEEEGDPHSIFQIQPNTVSITPRGASGFLTVSMFLKPSQDAEVLPAFLLDQWGEAIGHGALARILELPNQPYTDPNAAMRHRALFERAKDSNFNASVRGQQRAPRRSRSRFL